jgi:beta-glucosidase/6-phospho-beta-glucosidase/beta-galactosidase
LQAWSRYRLPLFVTENGIAERPPDTRRPKYIRDHVAQIERAKWMGADVRGYFYWSLMDNFEWDRGFKPPFGLLTILPDHPGQFRWTRGAFEYERIIRNHGAHGSLSDPLPKHTQAPDNC